MKENERKWRKIFSFEDKIILSIPEEWEKPSGEVLERKFPYESKPQEIYGNGDGSRLITFNLLEQELKEDEVYAAIGGIQRMVGHIYPESIEKASRTLKTAAGMTGWFYYVTGGINWDQGHIMFVLSLQNNMFFGGYHFPAVEQREEENLFLEMLGKMEKPEEERYEAAKYGRNRIQ